MKLYGVPPQDTGFADTMTDGFVGVQGGREDERQYTGYGDVTYYALPGLKLSAGLRYIIARSAFTYYEGAYFNQGPAAGRRRHRGLSFHRTEILGRL